MSCVLQENPKQSEMTMREVMTRFQEIHCHLECEIVQSTYKSKDEIVAEFNKLGQKFAISDEYK